MRIYFYVIFLFCSVRNPELREITTRQTSSNTRLWTIKENKIWRSEFSQILLYKQQYAKNTINHLPTIPCHNSSKCITIRKLATIFLDTNAMHGNFGQRYHRVGKEIFARFLIMLDKEFI
jgi:hypothetical protein